MAYELWDHESGNRLGVYSSEDEALHVAAEMVSRYRPTAKLANSLSLFHNGGPGQVRLLAEGRALADRARELNRSRPSKAGRRPHAA